MKLNLNLDEAPIEPSPVSKLTKKEKEKAAKPVEVVQVSTGDLKAHPKNYRTHPDDQLDHLISSIKSHGFYRNVVATQDGTILAGHGVVAAAKKMGLATVPVVYVDISPDDPKALALLVGDNEISHLCASDDRALTELLATLKADSVDNLLGTGYDEMMLANLLMITRPAKEIADFDAAAEWVGMPEYVPGETSLKIIVHLKDETDRAKFMDLIQVPKTRTKNGDTWAICWPYKANRKKYEEAFKTEDTTTSETTESEEKPVKAKKKKKG